MSGNTFGKIFCVTTWGESHGPGVGVVIDGCPAGLSLSEKDIQKELDRRRTGQSKVSTSRKEKDRAAIFSGVFKGKTTGAPISILVENHDADSSSYEKIKDLFRPGHADFTYNAKYGFRDYRGGGRSSGRETVGRVAAGAVAKKLLASHGMEIFGYTIQIHDVMVKKFDRKEIERNGVRCPDKHAGKLMVERILEFKDKGDSVGGIIEIRATGVPAGLGEPVFDKLDADLAKAIMSLGAVKGVEIGAGFRAADMLGSQNNDPFVSKDGVPGLESNNSGGILGGISTGADIILRAAVKPTPSISIAQRTVDAKGKERKLRVEGRHDPCICPRIIPGAESMVAITLADHFLRRRASMFFS